MTPDPPHLLPLIDHLRANRSDEGARFILADALDNLAIMLQDRDYLLRVHRLRCVRAVEADGEAAREQPPLIDPVSVDEVDRLITD